MKTITELFTTAGKSLADLVMVGLLLLGCSLPALGQTPISPKVYPLLSSTIKTNASLTNAETITLNGPAFQIWRDRGFDLNISCLATDTTTANLTFLLQFATPTTNSGSLTTNWNTHNKLTVNVPLNSTTRVYSVTNIPKTIVDNCTLGRLLSVQNGHTNTVTVDGTNTFVSVFP